MDLKKLRPTPEYYEQLALELDLPDEDRLESGFVSPAEAQRRSETARAALGVAGHEDAPAWFEQYHQLLTFGWPWRVACYIAWAASPKRNRWPKTQEKLAMEVLGLTSDRQIATWRKKNPGIDEMIAVLQAIPLMEYRADAFMALGVSAGDPDHRHKPDRQLFFEMTGDYTPKIKVDDARRDAEGTSQYTEKELEVMAGLLRKKNGENAEDQS
jgi:hypothetical protein